jgi:hypothetical protein
MFCEDCICRSHRKCFCQFKNTCRFLLKIKLGSLHSYARVDSLDIFFAGRAPWEVYEMKKVKKSFRDLGFILGKGFLPSGLLNDGT